MLAGKKYIASDGIEYFMCPFTDMYITQGSNMKPSHMGIMANDVRGKESGVRYPYFAPCKSRCVKIYPSSGQAMWQSVNKVRFANGRVDYATYMTVHDNTFNAYVGEVVEQGNQLGNMGDKGYATGVHCHIEVSQSGDTSWTKNQYGVWHFNNEYDLDDCYFVDDTNILYGMGGNWKETKDVPVVSGADQILYKGSKVKFDGIIKVDIVNTKINCFGSCKLTGCSFNAYQKEKVQPYHWIPCNPFVECDTSGSPTSDQVLSGGNSYVKNDNVYEVKDIDSRTNSAKLNIDGRDVWIISTYLYEVSDR